MTTPTEKSAEEIAAEMASEKGAEKAGFDVDTALNTKGFAVFLAKHDDPKDFDIMKNEGELSKRFEVFQIKEEVKSELKDLYSNQIQREMGIKLEAADLSAIDAHLEKQAIENPAELIEMKTKLVLFEEFPKQIAGLEDELANLGGVESLAANLEALKKDAADLVTAKENMGVIGKTKLAYEAISFCLKTIPTNASLAMKIIFRRDVKFVSAEDSLLEDVKNNIFGIEEKLASIQRLEEARKMSQEMFGKIRKELLGGISGIDELTKAIQGKVAKQFQEMIRTGTLQSLDKVQERFEFLRNVAQTTETGVNPLEGLDQDMAQEKIDAELEKKASDEIVAAVLKVNVGNNALTNLEKAVKPFLEREKIGSKEGDEAREFMKNTLEEASQKLGNSNDDKAKKLMIARIIIKMNS